MTNGDDYTGVPDTSSVQTDTGSQATQATTPTPQSDTGSQQTGGSDTSQTGDAVLQEAVKQYDNDRARETEAQKYYDNMRQQINDINARIMAMPNPTPPEHIPIPALPDQQQQQRQQNGSIGTMLAQGIMIAWIASVVFGRRHNPWATAAITSGMGSFINGFTKAQHEAATDQLSNWNKSVEYAVKMNQEADRTYNEVLANKRLDLTQQMDLIKTIAAQRQDVQMYAAATSKDLNQIIRVVEQHAKANSAMSRAQIDVNSRAANLWLKSKVGNSWSMYVMEQSRKDEQNGTGHYIDPTKDEASFREARDKYSPTQWMDSHTTSGAAKKTSELSYGKLATESNKVLGKDWTNVLENDEPIERGRIVPGEKEESTGFLAKGWMDQPKKVPDPDNPVWKPDPKGDKYSFGEDDTAKIKNAKSVSVVDALKAKYDKLKAQTEGGEKTDNYPTITTKAEARNYPAGTLFRDGQGNLREVITQNPLQVSKPLDEGQASE